MGINKKKQKPKESKFIQILVRDRKDYSELLALSDNGVIYCYDGLRKGWIPYPTIRAEEFME